MCNVMMAYLCFDVLQDYKLQLPNVVEKSIKYTKQHTNLKQMTNALIAYGLWVIIYDFDDSKSGKTIHSNPDIPPPSLSACGILSTEISKYTIFRFTATLDIKTKIPVSIQWRNLGIFT